jgi:spermidine synthase
VGLIYEVAWTKALGLIFGHTVYATAVVLAVFMAGLALGSSYFGSRPRDGANQLNRYVRLECLAGLTGGLSLFALNGVRRLYTEVYPTVSSSQPMLDLLRIGGTALVLFAPTFFMGGTLPVLVQALTRRPQELGVRFSQLYWANTLGAVIGTVMAGFVLLPVLGLRSTIITAALLNVLVGLSAGLLGKGHDHHAPRCDSSSALRPVVPHPTMPMRHYVLGLVFALIGSTAFAFELAWTRLLSIVVGSSVYAFTLMLATFLAGTVIGSILFQCFRAKMGEVTVLSLARSQLSIGATMLLSLLFFDRILTVIPGLLRLTNETFSGLVLTQAVTSIATVLPVAVAFGFSFPLTVLLLDQGASQHSKSVGGSYAMNTIGAIIGSLIAGFWLIPRLGSYRVLAATAAVNSLLSLVLYVSTKRRRPLTLVLPSLCSVVAIVIGSSPFFYKASSPYISTVLYGNAYHGRLRLNEIAATFDLVFAADGPNSSVAVVRGDGSISLRINGKTDASTGDARTQQLLAHIGAAFGSRPKRVLVIGFGSGMTIHAISLYPGVDKIDCVEIEPAVIQAAPYLKSLNHNVFRDRRVHFIFDDARSFLLTSSEQYDLIISEPSNPWIAGIATLFTNEFYVAARRRLAPGGVFVQWLQAYSLELADVRMVLATFAPHFPEVTLWHGEKADLLILGRTDPKPFDFRQVRRWWQIAAIRKQLESVNIHEPEGLIAYFILDDPTIRTLSKGAVKNTDDRTLLEYSAPRALLKNSLVDLNYSFLTRLRSAPFPANLDQRELGSALKQGLVTALDLGDAESAQSLIAALESQPPSVVFYVGRARLALAHGAYSEARSFLQAALKLGATSVDANYWLATTERRVGAIEAADAQLKEVLRLDSTFPAALEDQLHIAIDRGDFSKAVSIQLSRISSMQDPPAYEYCRLGGLWLKISKFDLAESVLLKGLAKDPYTYACHLELGELHRKTGRFTLARDDYEWAVRFFPDADSSVFRTLAGVYLVLGQTDAAASIVQKGLRIFPDDIDLGKAQLLVAK